MTKYIVTAYDISEMGFRVNWNIPSLEVAMSLYKDHFEKGRIHLTIGKQVTVKETICLEVTEE